VLAERVRVALGDRLVTTKPMFGGITFILNGNMLCAVSEKGLMARVGAEREPEALSRPFAARCMGAGRPMAGFILVQPPGVAADTDLKEWLDRALAYVERLPPKPKTSSRARARKIATPRGAHE
jgi:TfoX/Sxy family transcriptional regulator of competence genes